MKTFGETVVGLAILVIVVVGLFALSALYRLRNIRRRSHGSR